MTFGLHESIIGHQKLLFHQVRYCPSSLPPSFEKLVAGLQELVNCLGEILSDFGVIVFALDEYCPSGLFLAKHPHGYEF